MSNLPFPPELRTMSIVPRWSICWTLNRDYLSNHSFFVGIYAHDIARMLEWTGPVSALMYLALTHDLDELATGDVVGPAKREIIDVERAEAYVSMKLNEKLPRMMEHIDRYLVASSNWESDILAIIAVADRLDALLFLITEQRLGNTVIGPRAPDAQSRLEAAWFELPAERDELQRLWNTAVLPSIAAQRGQGGFGI